MKEECSRSGQVGEVGVVRCSEVMREGALSSGGNTGNAEGLTHFDGWRREE